MTWTPYTLVTDRLGSVRAIVDMSSGTVVERDDYYPYGKRIATPSSATSSYPQLATNRWRFSGKEEQDSLAFRPYLDFGARQYNPEVASWLAPDPLATDYPGLSPYVYCAGDPVNLVETDGENWYSYQDENGDTCYKYVEGQMSGEEMREGNYTDMGYTFSNHGFYYSRYFPWHG